MAFEFQRLLDTGEVETRAELASRFGVSRARITQVLNILSLPGPVVNYLSSLPEDGQCRFTERGLRSILRLPTEEQQIEAFEELRQGVQGSCDSVSRVPRSTPGLGGS